LSPSVPDFFGVDAKVIAKKSSYTRLGIGAFH
jgi:hypothetical protein